MLYVVGNALLLEQDQHLCRYKLAKMLNNARSIKPAAPPLLPTSLQAAGSQLPDSCSRS